MRMIIFDEAGANAVAGRYGKFSELDPIKTPDGNYMLPEVVLSDADLKAALPVINDNKVGGNDILPLPDVGEECVAGVLYISPYDTLENGGSNVVKCVQTHNRTEHNPKDIPALFTFFRDNADDLVWIQNEWVYVGWKRVYNGTTYECIQAHMTIEGQTPDVTPALWNAESPGIPVWKQPTGAHDAYNIGDQVHFPTASDPVYESLINANVWSPAVYPAGWMEL
jgi:hypothetical protein